MSVVEAYPFQAIAAMAANRVIGAGNHIPWHLPEDFRWFKATTMGHDLIMGRRTFESIGRPLPGRRTIVLSQSGYRPKNPDVVVCASLSQLPSAEAGRIRFICGGGEIYRLALPMCSCLYLTRVKQQCEGDCLFPPFEDLFELDRVLREEPEFVIERYQRKAI